MAETARNDLFSTSGLPVATADEPNMLHATAPFGAGKIDAPQTRHEA
jgi:hypothetical protein